MHGRCVFDMGLRAPNRTLHGESHQEHVSAIIRAENFGVCAHSQHMLV
jgi:hypothetical protein